MNITDRFLTSFIYFCIGAALIYATLSIKAHYWPDQATGVTP